MVFEEVRNFAGKIAPPLGVSAVFAFAVWRDGVLKQDWPVVGEFLMTGSLKSFIVACITCVVFVGWAVWAKHSPKFYTSEVYDDVRFLRDYLDKLRMPQLLTYEEVHTHIGVLDSYRRKVPLGAGRKALQDVYDSIGEFYLFTLRRM